MQRKRIADASKGVGRPKVGGTFELVDQNGKPFTSEMMNGKYSLVCSYYTCGSWPWHLYILRVWLGIIELTMPASGLFWIHSLSRHLPRRARQNGQDARCD